MHNKCDVLESSQNLPLLLWKYRLPRNWSLVPKSLGTAAEKNTNIGDHTPTSKSLSGFQPIVVSSCRDELKVGSELGQNVTQENAKRLTQLMSSNATLTKLAGRIPTGTWSLGFLPIPPWIRTNTPRERKGSVLTFTYCLAWIRFSRVFPENKDWNVKRREYGNFGTLRRKREITPKDTKGRRSQRKETMIRDTSCVSQFCWELVLHV